MTDDNPMTLQEAFEASQAEEEKPTEESSEELTNKEEQATEEPEAKEAPKEEESKEETPKEEPKAEEAPLEKFDPSSLPPELKATYDNLMKGFTQGRQKDREQVNALKAELKELQGKLSEDKEPEFQELTPTQLRQLTPEQQAQYFASIAEYKAQKVAEEERLKSFRQQALEDYNALDPRLTKDSDTYDTYADAYVGSKLDELLSEHVDQHGTEIGFDYKTHGARLVKEWDEFLDSHVKSFVEKQNQIVKKKAAETVKKTPKTSSAPARKDKMSISEAIRTAWDKHTN